MSIKPYSVAYNNKDKSFVSFILHFMLTKVSLYIIDISIIRSLGQKACSCHGFLRSLLVVLDLNLQTSKIYPNTTTTLNK